MMPIAAIAQRKLLERLLLPQTSHHLVRGGRDMMPIAAIAQRKCPTWMCCVAVERKCCQRHMKMGACWKLSSRSRKLLEKLLLPQTSHHLVRGSRDMMPIAAIAQRKLLGRLLLPQTSHHLVRGIRDLKAIRPH